MSKIAWRKVAKHRRRLDNRKWTDARNHPAPCRVFTPDEVAAYEAAIMSGVAAPNAFTLAYEKERIEDGREAYRGPWKRDDELVEPENPP